MNMIKILFVFHLFSIQGCTVQFRVQYTEIPWHNGQLSVTLREILEIMVVVFHAERIAIKIWCWMPNKWLRNYVLAHTILSWVYNIITIRHGHVSGMALNHGWDWLIAYEPLTRYVNFRVAHTPGMPRTFSPPPTSTETASWRSRHFRCMQEPQLYVSGKRPMNELAGRVFVYPYSNPRFVKCNSEHVWNAFSVLYKHLSI